MICLAHLTLPPCGADGFTGAFLGRLAPSAPTGSRDSTARSRSAPHPVDPTPVIINVHGHN